MIANNADGPRLRLRKSKFDQAADAHFGSDASDRQVAELLGVNKTSLSLYRNGHRPVPATFVATVLARFDGAKFEDLFEYDTVAAS